MLYEPNLHKDNCEFPCLLKNKKLVTNFSQIKVDLVKIQCTDMALISNAGSIMVCE